MAKTRRGKSSASRAKGATKKSAAKSAKKRTAPKKMMAAKGAKQLPPGLDLKKLRKDIADAQAALTKRLEGMDPESPKGKKLATTQSMMSQWSVDINSMCGTSEEDEPCGTGMVIS